MSREDLLLARSMRMRWVLERRQLDLELVLDNLWDRYNVSAIIRTADAFGVGAVRLLYWKEPIPRVSAGVSGNVARWVRTTRHDSVDECFAGLRSRGLRICAASVGAPTSYVDVDWTVPSAIVMGHERDGCSPEVLDAVDLRFAIPMQGFVQSLNVSVAAGVLLAEVGRQRAHAGLYEPRWDDIRQATFDRWVSREQTGEPKDA